MLAVPGRHPGQGNGSLFMYIVFSPMSEESFRPEADIDLAYRLELCACENDGSPML